MITPLDTTIFHTYLYIVFVAGLVSLAVVYMNHALPVSSKPVATILAILLFLVCGCVIIYVEKSKNSAVKAGQAERSPQQVGDQPRASDDARARTDIGKKKTPDATVYQSNDPNDAVVTEKKAATRGYALTPRAQGDNLNQVQDRGMGANQVHINANDGQGAVTTPSDLPQPTRIR